MHSAIASGHVPQVERWLELGANVDKLIVDPTRTTPLMLAAAIRDNERCEHIVRALLEAGAQIDDFDLSVFSSRVLLKPSIAS